MKKTKDAAPSKKIRRTALFIAAVLLCLLLIAVLGFTQYVYRFGDTPGGSASEKQVFVIHPGQNIHAAARELHARKIISSPFLFKALSRLKGLDRQLKAGEYHLSAAMTPDEILDVVVTGKSILYRVTIPEGYNLHQIAQAIDASGLGPSRAFYAAATNPELTGQMGLAAPTFEGYLFPDTYFFPKDSPPRTMIAAMLNRFYEIFTDDWKKRAEHLGFTMHQIVTLASIIEKETGVAAERPMISSVFHNRLKKRMRLESDPTVIYGIPDFNGNITRKHLKTHTPYNTYRIRGLPPGPIANPGRDALQAALFPADTDYLFFVAKRDRTHKFSKTMREHKRAVRRYQLRKR